MPEAELWGVFNMGCGFVAVRAGGRRRRRRSRCSPRTTRAPRASARSPATAGAVGVPPLGVAL